MSHRGIKEKGDEQWRKEQARSNRFMRQGRCRWCGNRKSHSFLKCRADADLLNRGKRPNYSEEAR